MPNNVIVGFQERDCLEHLEKKFDKMKRPKVLSGQGFFILQKIHMLVYLLIRVSIEIHKLMEKLCHDFFIQKSNNLQTLEPGEDVREQKMVPLNLLLICTTKKVTLPNNQ